MSTLEGGFYFCGNPSCRLHIRPGDAGVTGSGNWAATEDGIVVGRTLWSSAYFCDTCAAALREGRLSLNFAPAPKPVLPEQSSLDLG